VKPIATFELTLKQAPLLNEFMFMHWAVRSRLAKQIALAIMAQVGRRSSPLHGRPKLVVTRYSTRKPDQDNAGTKLWLDQFTKLGWLTDDSDEYVEIVSRWEKAKPKQGRVVVEVFSDEQASAQFAERQGW
jgi:Holliday junction resolvase RusA-like endonuclease